MKRITKKTLTGVIVLSLSLTGIGSVALLTGCGGGTSHESTGTSSTRSRATVKIIWPERTTRLIPTAANSITVSFLKDDTVAASQTVARPTSGTETTVDFSSLPIGTLTVKAEAFPETDGSGVAQASMSSTVTIVSGEVTPVSITMASTIDTLKITPTNVSLAAGATAQLTATAMDTSDNIVLTSASTISWTSTNTGIVSVDANGLALAVANGVAQITATESESGKTATVTVTVSDTGTGTSIADLANAYLNTLTTAQKSATLVSNTAANAAKWSNLPAVPGTGGTTTLRSGIAYSTLTDTQKAAWNNLVVAVLGANGASGNARLTQIRASDNYLGTLQSGYNGDYIYVAFVGTPSTSGGWLLQIGGHHIANNYYFNGSTLATTTPYFLGVEPQTFTASGTTYTPLQSQRNGMFNLISSLDSTQLATAKLSSNFSDVYLGPGKDARSNFPTGTSGRGILASSLTTAQKTLLKTAIKAWTQDSAQASTYQTLYESELDQTYVAYSGTTSFANQGDYVRIDGPHVWIEFVCQNGVVLSGQIHFHTIWRDRVTDYNSAYGF